MQSEIFKFKTATSQESMNNAVRLLSAVAGVGNVTPSLPLNELSVQFNADLASKQSLQAVLRDAGYALQTGNPNGGCGGGCTCG